MSKKKQTLFVGVTIIILGGAIVYYRLYNKQALPHFIDKPTYKDEKTSKYIIKKANQIVLEAETLEEAKEKAAKIKRSIVINTYTNEWVICNIEPYFIITDVAIHDFKTFSEAYHYATKNGHSKIYYKSNKKLVWEEKDDLIDTQLAVPLIGQYPELPRGCEVTSLAMLLQYRGINIDKMVLAQEVKKEKEKYVVDDKNRIYYGNPYKGFVGDMYDITKQGYGVYHGPIVELAEQYVGDKAIDLTTIDFKDLLYFVEQGSPVWIIINSTYKPLGDNYFEMWHTPSGIVKITKRLHAVIITGFTDESIYINDPLYRGLNKKVNRSAFQLAWEQMGSQAMTILN